MTGPVVTIGVEEEFHLVDPAERTLSDTAEEVLAVAGQAGTTVQAELKSSELETATPVCTRLPELRDQIAARRAELLAAADEVGVGVVAAGTLPAPYGDGSRPFPKRRYERLVAEYAAVGREQLVCAMQVQVGVEDRDLAVAALPRIAPWLPALLALSGSSPFYDGVDTGYASYRSVLWSRWPSSGVPPVVGSAAEWDAVVGDLVRSGTIADPGMVYFDVRPSATYPTLEIRICDSTPLLDDVVTLAGLGRALVVTALREVSGPARATGPVPAEAPVPADAPVPAGGPAVAGAPALAGGPVPAGGPVQRAEIVRGASWRAARSGLGGVLVDPREPVARPARQVLDALLEHVRPALDGLGDTERVRSGLDALLRRGTSADRQRAAYGRAERLADAVDQLLAETRRDL